MLTIITEVVFLLVTYFCYVFCISHRRPCGYYFVCLESLRQTTWPGKVSSYLTLCSVDENHNAMHLDFIIDQTTKEGTYHKPLACQF